MEPQLRVRHRFQRLRQAGRATSFRRRYTRDPQQTRSNLFLPLRKALKREGSQAGALTPPAGVPMGGHTKILHGPRVSPPKVSTSTDTVPVLVNTGSLSNSLLNVAFLLPALLTAYKTLSDASFKT